ncbi:MAG: hypothetical protein FH748_10160 [Balneolaceae bacterium]|nr:hypothetical protein [Balneolaceae bacterium]
MKKNLTIIASLVFILSCSIFDNKEDRPGKIPIQELMAAPDTLYIDSQPFVLRTYMWRDFQPISPPDGKPLIAIFWVYSADSTKIPESLTANAAWIINENKIWDTYLTGEEPPPSQQQPYQLYEVARNGPKWGPGIEVDVVLQLQSNTDGNKHLIRASTQFIGRTD